MKYPFEQNDFRCYTPGIVSELTKNAVVTMKMAMSSVWTVRLQHFIIDAVICQEHVSFC